MGRAQLVRLGVTGSAISRWVSAGRLHRVHPHVYAVGHQSVEIHGRLIAALLYAGPKAVLSHTTAAWWWQVLPTQPNRIHVSVSGYRKSLPAVCIHHPRDLQVTRHRSLPLTTIPRTLLDLAATLPFADLRRALAEADYHRLLDPEAVASTLGSGRPGSAALGRALASHLPQLAQTLSVLEERFLILCESSGLPQPEVNASIEGFMVDALFRRQRVVVELDGRGAHATLAAIESDRRRDLTLRAAGYTVLRYTWSQVTRETMAVAADICGALRAS